MAHRRFTIEEADDLLPVLELEMGEVVKARERAAAAASRLGGMERALAIARGASVSEAEEPDAIEFARATLDLAAAVERINATGCLVEDLERGLVDFPSLREGEEIRLCWQYGEARVAHWHWADEGVEEREAIGGATAEVEPKIH